MDLYFSLWFMMIGSFIIQMFFMSLIMSNSLTNITFSIGKFYLSLIMALLMGLLELIMYDIHLRIISIPFYLYLGFPLIIIIYLYRNQVYIYDTDYLKEMIEHHAMAILTSEEILQKTKNERIKRLAESISNLQQEEINYMKKLLENI
jgi:hypothetical protein